MKNTKLTRVVIVTLVALLAVLYLSKHEESNVIRSGAPLTLSSSLHDTRKITIAFDSPSYLCQGKYPRASSFKSQIGQDKKIFDAFFKNTCGGTFLEMGAADGISHSNTYAFEMDLNWKGMLIEASPITFKALAARVERNNSVKINGVAGDEEKLVTYIDIQGYSQQLGCIKEFASPQHLSRIESELSTYPHQIRTDIPVEMKPLNNWILSYGIKRIDFFSLDVEGAEYVVLKSFDFSKVHVSVLMHERGIHDVEIENIMLKNGFSVFQKDGQDIIYCHSSICPK